MKGEAVVSFGGLVERYTLPWTQASIGFAASDFIRLPVSGQKPRSVAALSWNAKQSTWMLIVSSDAGSSFLINGRTILMPGDRHPLANGDEVLMYGAVLRFRKLNRIPMVNGTAVTELKLDLRPLVIGREAQPDAQTDGDGKNGVRWELDPDVATISKDHVLIEREGADYVATDVSKTGTEWNGKPFIKETLLYGDRIRVADYLFEFTGDALRWIDNPDAGRICGENLVVVRGGKKKIKILDLEGIRLDIRSGEFIGILGGSGQGKSTLLNALCGINPATSGTVAISGVALSDREKLRDVGVGYVPQDDIVHTELTVLEAMHYSCRLRLRLTDRERVRLVDETIRSLSLEPFRNRRVSRLSGGQRKRVSVGIELLARPSVLFLDEPSSGLDPATEGQLMELFQSLAESGLTVICTTHVLQKAYLFSRLMWVHDGKVIFLGSTDQARTFLLGEVNNATQPLEGRRQSPLERLYQEVLVNQSHKRGKNWEEEFMMTEMAPLFLPSGLASDNSPSPPKRAAVPAMTMLQVLLARQWKILLADPLNLLFLFAQALAIAFFISWLAPSPGLRNFLSVVAVLWFGCSNGAQQLVAERQIFRRERVCGLGLNVYLLSKIVFLFALTCIQSLLLTGAVVSISPLFHPVKISEEAWQNDERFTAPEKDQIIIPDHTFGLEKGGTEFVASIVDKTDKSVTLNVTAWDVDKSGKPKAGGSSAGQLGQRDFPIADLTSSSRRFVSHWEPPVEVPVPLGPTSQRLAKWFARAFDLQDNIVESCPTNLKNINGEDMNDPKGRPIRWPGVPVWSVIGTCLGFRFLALMATALVGISLGLAASALVRTATQAVMWVPLLLIPQILFGGFVVILAEMGMSARTVAWVVPSASAQRVMETSEVYGKMVPFIANRTKIPSFFAADETVEWGDPLQSSTYPTLHRSNTAWQNLVVNLDLPRFGERKQERESDKDANFKMQVRDRRPEVLPGYKQGTVFQSTSIAANSLMVLMGWSVLCYFIVLYGLRRAQKAIG